MGKHGYHDKQDTNHGGTVNIFASEADERI